MTAVSRAPLRLVTCRSACPAGPSRAHHDRLLAVDTDPVALLELIELAVTWHELDYSVTTMVGPAEWETFAQRHRWSCPEQAEQAFLLATDIVARGAPRTPVSARVTMLDTITG
jgi:hypothetical protein